MDDWCASRDAASKEIMDAHPRKNAAERNKATQFTYELNCDREVVPVDKRPSNG